MEKELISPAVNLCASTTGSSLLRGVTRLLILALFVLTPSALFGQYSKQVLIQTGDPSPDGNGVAVEFSEGNPPVLNDNGQVVFIGRVGDVITGSDFAVITGGSVPLLVISRENNPAPDGNGAFAIPIGVPGINSLGVINFKSEFKQTVGGGEQRMFTTQGGLTEIVRSGDPPPGGNGVFESFEHSHFSVPVVPVTALGQTSFRGTTTGTAGGLADEVGIYRAEPGTITEIAREGTSYPGIGTLGVIHDSVINDAGQVLVEATLVSNPGIYIGDGFTLTKIFHSGDPSPDGMGTISSVFARQAAMNNGGFVAAIANIDESPSFSDQAIITFGVQRPSTVVARSRQLDPLGNVWRAFGNSFVGAAPASPSMNDAGEIAFGATTSPNQFGPFQSHIYAGLPGAFTVVVSGGDPAPDGNGNFLNAFGFGRPMINANGDVAFIANLENTLTGEENSGLFFWDSSTGRITQVARQGEAFAGDRIFALSIAGFPQAGRSGSAINDQGQIAFQFRLFNDVSGIAIASPTILPVVSITGFVAIRSTYTLNWTLTPPGTGVDIYRTGDFVAWTRISNNNLGTSFVDNSIPPIPVFYIAVPTGAIFP